MIAQLSPEDSAALYLLIAMNCELDVVRRSLQGRPITVRYRGWGKDESLTGKIFSTNPAFGMGTSDTVLRVEYADDEGEWAIRGFSVKDIIRPGTIDVDLSDISPIFPQIDARVLKLLRLMYGDCDQRDSLRNAEILFADDPGHIKGARKAPKSEEMMIDISYKDDHQDWHKPMTVAALLQGTFAPLIDHLSDPATQPRKPIAGLEIPVQAET
ncbi:MAG: hypothetical protein WCG99_00225 [Candidatus Berkelbacteria bacterium]